MLFKREDADRNAEIIRKRFNIRESTAPKAFLILGTGWGDKLALEAEQKLPLRELPCFAKLGDLAGHDRALCYGQVNGMHVLAQRGRIHVNEGFGFRHLRMVRLQVEQAIELGVRTFVFTNAVGSLAGRAHKGQVVAVDGLVTVFAPPLPLNAGEFGSPEDCLDPMLVERAQLGGPHTSADLAVLKGGYAMLRGPFFEGRRYDKALLASTGAYAVGMSLLPELAVLAARHTKRRPLRALCLSYVTNDDKEEHSHEANIDQAKKKADALRLLLEHVLAGLD